MLKPEVEADLSNIFPLGESGYMESKSSHTTAQRVTCNIPGRRNDLGKPKLVATIDETGIQVWCRYCKKPHLVSRAQCEAAWERGESVIACIAKDDVAGV